MTRKVETLLIPPDIAAQASIAGRDLATATEELNESIRDVEDAFAEWQLGVTAAVNLELPNDTGTARRLRYRKQKNAWLLVVEVESDPKNPQPLTTQSRAIRLQALTCVPALSRALLDEARSQIAAIHNAIADVQRFLASMDHP